MHITSPGLFRDVVESYAAARTQRGEAGLPRYRLIAEGLSAGMLDGRIPLDSALPGERSAATYLGVSRTTVSTAYRLLTDSGYLEVHGGARPRTRTPERRPRAIPIGRNLANRLLIDLNWASVSADGEALRLAYGAAAEELPSLLPGSGLYPAGIGALRVAVAEAYSARGLATDPEQIVVTAGALQAIDLVTELLARPGAQVALDHPTFAGAIGLFRRRNLRFLPCDLVLSHSPGTEPGEAEGAGPTARPVSFGWDPLAWERALRARPAFGYLVADVHNPTGFILPAPERERIARTAAAQGVPLVIDESLRDLARPEVLPATFATFVRARTAPIFTLGSLSKTVWAGLRVGWIRAPHEYVDRLVRLREIRDYGSPVIEQLAACRLLADLGEIAERRRAELSLKRRSALATVRELLPEWAVAQPAGGLALWCRMPSGSAAAVAAELAGEILLSPGSRFGVNGAFDRWLRLPITGSSADFNTAAGAISATWTRCGPRRTRVTQQPLLVT